MASSPSSQTSLPFFEERKGAAPGPEAAAAPRERAPHPDSPGTEEERSRLSAEVLGLSLRQVRSTYHEYNTALFGGRLRAPQLEFSSNRKEWGAWVRAERILRLSVALLEKGWGHLTEVLKHEMAHQYVDEVLGHPHDEGAHGPTFRRVCEERGIDPAAAGDPTEPRSEPNEHQKILDRIGHLLALAQSDNEHEAQAAMANARRLMLKYNLDASAAGAPRTYRFRHLGAPTGRRMAWQRALANLLTEFFFVEVIIVPVYRPFEKKRGSVIEVCGTDTNMEIASYTYDFLERAALALWKKHKQERGLEDDSDKQSYLYGVIRGFSEKLDRDAKKTEKEGLVWLGDPDLATYFRARHPHIRHVSGRGSVRKDAYTAGHDAGGRIVLHRGVREGSSSGPGSPVPGRRLLTRGGPR